MNSSRLDAFSSPNFPPIARVGVDIKGIAINDDTQVMQTPLLLVNWESVFRPSSTEKFYVHSDMNSNVGILRLFPGISKAAVSCHYPSIINCHYYLFFFICRSVLFFSPQWKVWSSNRTVLVTFLTVALILLKNYQLLPREES